MGASAYTSIVRKSKILLNQRRIQARGAESAAVASFFSADIFFFFFSFHPVLGAAEVGLVGGRYP